MERQELNNMIGEQLSTLIEQMHGQVLPFILIMPPLDDEFDAQLVTNIANVSFIQTTLRYLDESLSKVKKLENVDSNIQ